MFVMKEYPKDVMPLYSQGHSLAQMLIESHGKQTFLDFLSDGMADENWPQAVRKHYGYENLYALQMNWLEWVKAGRPPLGPAHDTGIALAAANAPPKQTPVVRAQSPDRDIRPIRPATTKSTGDTGSVYANIAARANPAADRRAPVYDATMRPGVMRR
jgi:hypothetical protein